MRFFIFLIFFAGAGCGAWYLWENSPAVRTFLEEQIEANEFQTLEVRFTAEKIMDMYRDELLKNEGYSYIEPKLIFHPYLMMEVKYTKESGSTGEGVLLWSFMDGEMVVETGSWEKTHGFEDCLNAKASKNDFKIIKALVENGGTIDHDQLYEKFKVDSDILDVWVDSCRAKKLIAVGGNQFRLHFEDPRLEIYPVTQLYEPLVTFPTKYAQKLKKKYTANQIKKLAEVAFGHDFTIRRTREIFLPVFNISVQNPDGSVLTTYVNALNGLPLQAQFTQ